MDDMAFTVRTDPEFDAALDKLTSARRVSRQELLRDLVIREAEATTRAARIDEISAVVREEWAEALDRLGSV